MGDKRVALTAKQVFEDVAHKHNPSKKRMARFCRRAIALHEGRDPLRTLWDIVSAFSSFRKASNLISQNACRHLSRTRRFTAFRLAEAAWTSGATALNRSCSHRSRNHPASSPEHSSRRARCSFLSLLSGNRKHLASRKVCRNLGSRRNPASLPEVSPGSTFGMAGRDPRFQGMVRRHHR